MIHKSQTVVTNVANLCFHHYSVLWKRFNFLYLRRVRVFSCVLKMFSWFTSVLSTCMCFLKQYLELSRPPCIRTQNFFFLLHVDQKPLNIKKTKLVKESKFEWFSSRKTEAPPFTICWTYSILLACWNSSSLAHNITRSLFCAPSTSLVDRNDSLSLARYIVLSYAS